jgi:mannose-6-phosphate isomerase-like protein (cupin superfamily)
MMIDPSHTYVHLAADGAATSLPGGEAFWSLPDAQLDRHGQSWLISEFECASDWPSWEMHPHADEFVYLLSGTANMLLELPDGVQSVALHGRGAVVVPRGVWHTAKVSAPSRMLFVTMGAGTQHRPA